MCAKDQLLNCVAKEEVEQSRWGVKLGTQEQAMVRNSIPRCPTAGNTTQAVGQRAEFAALCCPVERRSAGSVCRSKDRLT